MTMRCVLVGNNGVGKTSLIIAQVEGSGHPEYLPFVYDVTTAVSNPLRGLQWKTGCKIMVDSVKIYFFGIQLNRTITSSDI